MKIIDVELHKLKDYENNPRNNEEAIESVANSIKEFGFKVPIIVDKDYIIVAGHTRKKAAQELQLNKVPCIIADDLTEEQIKAFRLADNKTAELATWDFEKLEKELANINIDMEVFGFNEEDFNIEPVETTEDDFDVDEALEEEPVAKLGDIYQLGDHRLMCGDSTDKTTIEKLMNGVKANISFTSPPYNVGKNIGYEKETKYLSNEDNKSNEDYLTFLKSFTKLSLDYSTYSFVNIQSLANNKLSLINYLYEMKNNYADTMIWAKGFGVPAMAKNVLNSAYEYIHVFNQTGNKVVGNKEFRGTIPNIIELPPQRKNKYSNIHNATFPLEFAIFFVENFANKNDTVLDLFGGTGTTLVACEQLNRTCYMMELDPRYVDVIIKRWENLTGREAVKL